MNSCGLLDITEVIRRPSELFLSRKVARLLVILHQSAPGPGPQHPGDLLVAAVHVAAVYEGRDGVDLLPAGLATGGAGAGEVYTGYTCILPHWERRIRFGHVDVKTLGSTWVETAAFLRETGAADVVVQELAELHHHAADPLVWVVPLRECSSNYSNIGKVVPRKGAAGSEVMGILGSHQTSEWDISGPPVWVLDVIAATVYSLVSRGSGGKVTGTCLDKDCPEIFQVN